jgi:hypothetical protein
MLTLDRIGGVCLVCTLTISRLSPTIGLRGSSGEAVIIPTVYGLLFKLLSLLELFIFLFISFANMAAIPADGTWFDTIKKSFADVPVNAENGISTTEFLEAAESLVTLFGACCSTA